VAPTDRLETVADELGYRDTSGYVDGTVSEVGARDFVWRDLKDKCQVDAAYFRGAVPLVAFVETESQQQIDSAHRRLWNFGRVPVLIATTPQEVVALSCITPPALGPDATSPTLRSARERQSLQGVLGEFTRFNVESGRAATAYHERFSRHLRVDSRLLENLRRLRDRLVTSNLDTRDVEQLLGRSIFIRYLEDRSILSEEHLLELGRFQSFAETLAAGPSAVAHLFEALSDHFNGDVFKSSPTETNLPPQAIDDLGHFFSATDLESGQQSLWPYDFGVIPPELISSIYEQLLGDSQREDAAYYTPRHVVDLVLDELVPWQGKSAQPSILDPSCGSGTFLAEAFRRLAYRHIITDRQPPTFDRLAQLLTSSVYGVDKSPVAIGVSAFSLYLALLEHVDPPTAWREARLPVLVGQNLIESDFFKNHALSDYKFDLVVGNPPWKSSLSPAAAAYVRREKIKLPDQQIALAFLWRATDFTVEGGTVGLVLPAKSLLHNRSNPAEAARRRIFNDLNVETIVDLSPLRKGTFDAAVSPASIAIVRGRRAEGQLTGTVHVSPRQTPLASAIDGIVVSQENIRQVPQSLAATTTVVWKSYLWGGPADFNLISHLRETFPSLKTVVGNNDWFKGQGFQVNGGDEKDAREIVGMTLLSTSSIGFMRLLSEPSKVVTDSLMHRPRNPQLYRAPHVIMRKGFRDYPMSTFLDFDAAFTDGLYAIAGPAQDAQELRVISGLLNSSAARYWFFMTSSSWGVEREQIQPSEYLSLPIPPINSDLQREIISAVKLAANSKSGEAEWMPILDAAVFRAYEFTPDEQDLVRDGLSTRLDEYRHGSEASAYQPPLESDLATYAHLIASQLNATESVQWSAELSERSAGFAVVACKAIGITALEPVAPFSLDRLMALADTPLEGWRSPAAVMQPSVIVVEGTNVYLVKPDERRSWTRSAARSDAAEVLSAVLMVPASREI
jgi:SAM-dependent methyltransferase